MGDIFRDVLVELRTRRARTLLLMAAVALATGALTASVAISRMAAVQIDVDLAATATRTIVVSKAAGGHDAADETFPVGAVDAVADLPLVEAVGLRADLTANTVAVVRTLDGTAGGGVSGLTVTGVTSQYVTAVGGQDFPTAWMLDEREPVVVLGEDAAARLDIPVSDVPSGHGVWINGMRYPVVGFLTGSPSVGDVVAMPYPLALEALGSDHVATMTVLTAPGGAGPVAAALRTAVRPDAPESLTTSTVVDAAGARRGVATQLDRLVAWVGGLLLALTMLLVANAMIVAVMSRTAEIGLRRAMGSSRRRIAMLVLCEGATAGAVGGATGAGLASVLVVVTAGLNRWTAHVDLVALSAAPLVGLLAAATASVYPAIRAAGVEPATAVRSD